MPAVQDGPRSPLFAPLPFKGQMPIADLPSAGVSSEMAAALEYAPIGDCICWGIPFVVGAVAQDVPFMIELPAMKAQWLGSCTRRTSALGYFHGRTPVMDHEEHAR